MISDSLQNASRLARHHPGFDKAFAYLAVCPRPLTGRVELDGEKLFVVFSEHRGKSRADALLEAHRNYIDIHYCFEGRETIGWRAVRDCTSVRMPYDEATDLITFNDLPAFWSELTPGMFAIYFPEDAHAPMISDGVVMKAVVKVACL